MNSILGASNRWKAREIDKEVERQVEKIPKAERKNTLMNVELKRCP